MKKKMPRKAAIKPSGERAPYGIRYCSRFDSEKKRHRGIPRYRITLKKRTLKQVTDLIREEILDLRKQFQEAKKKDPETSPAHWNIRHSVERVAFTLKVKPALVSQAFHLLNLEGLVSKKQSGNPRSGWHTGEIAWSASVYYYNINSPPTQKGTSK